MSRRPTSTVLSFLFVSVSFVWITAAYSPGSPTSAAPYCRSSVYAADAAYTAPYTPSAAFRFRLPVATGTRVTYSVVPSESAQAIRTYGLKVHSSGLFDIRMPKTRPTTIRVAFGYVASSGGCPSRVGHVVITEGLQVDLRATPTTGTAPRRVAFTSTVRRDPKYRYTITYGDGATAVLASPAATHTYKRRGTYRATLTVSLRSTGRRLGSAAVTVTIK